MKIIIQIITYCLGIIYVSILVKHYFPLYIDFMFNNSKWNKYLEKPRIAIYSFTTPLIIFSIYQLNTLNNYGNISTVLINSFPFLVLLVISLVISFTYLNNSSILKLIPKVQKNTFIGKGNHIECSVKNQNDIIQKSFKALNNEYFKCDFRTYECFINGHVLTKNQDRIKWICTKGKRNNKEKLSNIRPLIELINYLFDTEDNKVIENIIMEYFTDSDGKVFNISNRISKWSSSTPNYLTSIRFEYHNIFKP